MMTAFYAGFLGVMKAHKLPCAIFGGELPMSGAMSCDDQYPQGCRVWCLPTPGSRRDDPD
jgi:hypothetical protein